MARRCTLLRRSVASIAVVGAVWICAAQSDRKPATADPVFQDSVRPILTKYCVGCHSAKVASAGLNLEEITDTGASAKPEIWSRVFGRLSKNEMPPAAMPRPPQAELSAVTAWISANFKVALTASNSAPAAVGDAGRVTIRRLNRIEYNNTIRDLLGLNVDATANFPIDDSGYGFDNNGDVLSLSPMLLEKFIAIAASLSKLAIYGPDKPKPDAPLVRFRAANQPTIGALPMSLSTIFLPYSLRGVLEGNYEFPQDAEYEFSFRAQDGRGVQSNPPLPEEGGPMGPMTTNAYVLKFGNGVRNRAIAEAAKKGLPAPPNRRTLTPEQQETRKAQLLKVFPATGWVFELDGKIVAEGTPHAGGALVAEGIRPVERYRQRLIAGKHSFRIYYPEALGYENPIDNYNPDNRGRGLAIANLDIAGPFTGGPLPPLESRKKIFVCDEQTTACATRILENFASRAYRRLATPQDVRQLLAIFNLNFEAGEPFDESLRVAIQTVLQSPHFLFRVETTPKPEQIAGNQTAAAEPTARTTQSIRPYPVSDYELASRLSYFLWSSMPDDELMAAAKQEMLHQPAVLKAQMRRMLADPKSEELVKNFGGQWLGIRELMRRRPDPDLFRAVDDYLLTYMQQETYLFLSEMIKDNRSILDLIDAPFTYVNGPLANFYGIPGVQGLDFKRVDLKTNQRSGILTHGSVMMTSAMPTRTSVVTRGKWVLENILGTPPPPPPPDVPALDETDLGTAATLRHRMEQHRANPACAVCHNSLDPIGFSLENYDPAGAWRTKDGELPIDNTGTLPDGRSFQGASGLKTILRGQADQIARNITEKMLTFALGRGLESYDGPAVETILKRLKTDNYRMQTLIEGVIESKPFLMKDGESR